MGPQRPLCNMSTTAVRRSIYHLRLSNGRKSLAAKRALGTLAQSTLRSLVDRVRQTSLPTTRCYPMKGTNIVPLATPQEFYDTIIDGIRNAKKRLTLAALYLGTGPKEKELVKELGEALAREKQLEVRILLDHSRAKRGRVNSVTLLEPLLERFPHKIRVNLFQMPQLRETWLRFLPSPLDEVVAVSHVKACVSDGDVLLTGANLSDDYFTNRQDRYLLLRDAGGLSSFYHDLVDLMGCFAIPVNLPRPVPPERPFRDLCWDLLTGAAGGGREGQGPTDTRDTGVPPPLDPSVDTWVVPTVQCRPWGLRHEEAALQSLLYPAGDHPWTRAFPSLTLATAYLNPPRHFLDLLAAWPGATVLAPSPNTHGFSDARGIKAIVPHAYSLIDKEVCEYLGPGSSRLRHYDRQGWTFHGKGMWFEQQLSQGGRVTVTVAGSSNFGHRSFYRDFESQIFVFTTNEPLIKALDLEKARLLQYARPPILREPSTNPVVQAALSDLLARFRGLL